MEEQTTQSNVTYEDNVAETVLLAQQLPVGTYWKDDKHVYQIDKIILGNGIASAACTKLSLVSNGSLYDYQIYKSDIFVGGIAKLIQTDSDTYHDAERKIWEIMRIKNNELFQKQCLFNMPTDIPFTDFETLHDNIIELEGFQYFFYKPHDKDSVNCFRVMRVNMDTYEGGTTKFDEWHFYMDNTHVLAIEPNDRCNEFGVLVNRHKIYPITEYQFNGLVEFIENNPNQAV